MDATNLMWIRMQRIFLAR